MINQTPEHGRICEAYFKMANVAKHRPEAPSDGCLSGEEMADPRRLNKEASDYADRFLEAENALDFRIGVRHWNHNRVLVYTMEAARLLCCGSDATDLAIRLLKLALAEAKDLPSGSIKVVERMKQQDDARKLKAIELCDRWRAHRHDDCAGINTLYAVFGKSSSICRKLSSFPLLNPPYRCWLNDIAVGNGASEEEWMLGTHGNIEWDHQPRAQAAASMIEHQLSRGDRRSGRRRLTMTPEARTALLDYYFEELVLLREIEQFAVRDACQHREKRPVGAWRILRHIRALEMGIEAMEGNYLLSATARAA
jgi:hypothetical protein